ncbi:MAG: transketolase [Sphingobacteriia bacterium]|nr:transketolase [Sphingobacteriia bacterium]
MEINQTILDQLTSITTQVRRDILRMVHAVNSGHPGGSLGCAEFFTALYFNVLQHTPKPFSIIGKGEDVFFLSNGHISPVWYSVLARSGYFPVEELNTFRRIDSRLQGHPTPHEGLPGIRIASGSLGQGLSVACGVALAKKLDQDSRWVYTLHGDGELEEGQIWEAALFASHHKIDNLIATVDVNGQQIDGTTEQVMSLGNLRWKWEAFGWIVFETDGNDMKSLLTTLSIAKNATRKNKPVVILMKTVMGKGVSFMEGKHKWHGVAPNDKELEIALEALPETLGDYPSFN